MTRDTALQNFIDVTRQALAARLSPEKPAGQVAAKIFAALENPGAIADTPSLRQPVCDQLDAALENARKDASDIAVLADTFQTIEPRLSWSPRPGAEKVSEAFASGHANATIIGPDGIETRSDVRIGVSLMAPQVQYVDHHHPPAEVYLVLSPGTWRQADRPWHEPGVGGTVFNTPNIVHAMKSGEAPLFAIWCLLVQDS